ncbi:MAG: hypothetical protein ACJAWL_000555 [Motiliproteus sp.]|jgi:hypothetical protein
MSEFHRFNKILIIPLVMVSLVLVATSLYLDKPSNGNMTRVGGFSDNDYGWNQPQESYRTPLYQLNRSNYQGYSDLVVLGDSFSSGSPRMSWVNYVVESTGASAQVFHFDHGGVERILNSPAFKRTPPKYLVIQSIEASLYRRFSAQGCQMPPPQASHMRVHAPMINAGHYQTHPVTRETVQSGLNLDNAASYLARSIPRALGVNVTDTFRLALTRDDLFSSRIKDQVLIHEGDIAKRELPPGSDAVMACNLLQVQQQIEANGYTRMVIMVAPDKLTAYSQVLQDQAFAGLSIIPALATHRALNLIRLDLLLQQRVREGVVDLYLPNDTHWGSTGYQLAAEAIIEYLNEDE